MIDLDEVARRERERQADINAQRERDGGIYDSCLGRWVEFRRRVEPAVHLERRTPLSVPQRTPPKQFRPSADD